MANVGSIEEALSKRVAATLNILPAKATLVVDAFQDIFAARFSEKLSVLTLKQLIENRNPYLYRSMGINSCDEFVGRALDDYVSSSVETYYGPFFEAVARIVSGGIKPAGGGEIDLDVRYNGVVILYAIKSGPKGFNKSSRTRALQELRSAAGKLEQDKLRVEKKIAFAYGRKKTTRREDITFLSSKVFWTEISGREDFYAKLLDACAILAPLYAADVAAPRARLLLEAQTLFCTEQHIDWPKVLQLISGK